MIKSIHYYKGFTIKKITSIEHHTTFKKRTCRLKKFTKYVVEFNGIEQFLLNDYSLKEVKKNIDEYLIQEKRI